MKDTPTTRNSFTPNKNTGWFTLLFILFTTLSAKTQASFHFYEGSVKVSVGAGESFTSNNKLVKLNVDTMAQPSFYIALEKLNWTRKFEDRARLYVNTKWIKKGGDQQIISVIPKEFSLKENQRQTLHFEVLGNGRVHVQIELWVIYLKGKRKTKRRIHKIDRIITISGVNQVPVTPKTSIEEVPIPTDTMKVISEKEINHPTTVITEPTQEVIPTTFQYQSTYNEPPAIAYSDTTISQLTTCQFAYTEDQVFDIYYHKDSNLLYIDIKTPVYIEVNNSVQEIWYEPAIAENCLWAANFNGLNLPKNEELLPVVYEGKEVCLPGSPVIKEKPTIRMQSFVVDYQVLIFMVLSTIFLFILYILKTNYELFISLIGFDV